MHSINSVADISVLNVHEKFNEIHSNRLVSVGIHPWYINENNYLSDLLLLEQSIFNKNVVAIGECGLDKLIDIDFDLQKDVFKQQLLMAEKANKPLIVHCVKAFDDLIKIKKKLKVAVPIIVHGYNNNEIISKQLLENGFYFSFGKALLIENSNASKIISSISIDRIFLETDDADTSIKSIFEAASNRLDVKIEDLKKSIYSNYKKIFIHE